MSLGVTLGNVENPIESRILDSLTAGTYSGVYLAPAPAGALPSEAEKPVVLYSVSLRDREDSPHDTDLVDMEIELQVVGRRDRAMSECTDLLGRLWGDGDGARLAPTYGFQWHQLTGFRFTAGDLDVDRFAMQCTRISEVPQHTEEFFRFVSTYQAILQRGTG